MSILMRSPYNAPSQVIVLRNPNLNDTEAIVLKASVKTSMTGSVKTHKKTPRSRKLSFTFAELTRSKTLELEAYLTATAGWSHYVKDHNDVVWKLWLTSNPFETQTPSVGRGRESRKEANTITLQFEGYRT